MPRPPKNKFNEKDLTKGQIRKLTALRKSLGQGIADKAFAEWLATAGSEKNAPLDKNAMALVEALEPLLKNKRLRIPRGGFLITRWRDQVIVKPTASKK